KSINLETYIYKSDEIGWMIAEALAERARRGIEVNLMYDAVGSVGTSENIFDFLRENGVEIIAYHPLLPWRRFSKVTFRDHRKILVIDGRIAYIGGINIGSEYAGKKYHGGGWRDTHLRIEGLAVREIQFFFIENWFRQGGSIVRSDLHFPNLKKKGNRLMMVISTRSRRRIRPIFESYISAITHAKKTIYITNAYFIPNRRIYHALAKAAKRGVDVRLILPGESDMPLVTYASRYLYRYYLRHGISVYEYRGSMLHAKTAVIDGIWSTVGSSNMDRMSLIINLELNAMVLDSAFGEEMEKVFIRDMKRCTLIDPESYSRRPGITFFLEWLAYRFRNIL
ncbi:MAG: cardiolipin synthase, partial [Spirochaetota bacterium]